MLKKKFRLPKEGLKTERKIETAFCVLKIAKNNLPLCRFGFVVSKKVDKRAVARNRIKRILRGEVEENINNFKPGFDVLFIVKKEMGKKESLEIIDNIKEKGFLNA